MVTNNRISFYVYILLIVGLYSTTFNHFGKWRFPSEAQEEKIGVARLLPKDEEIIDDVLKGLANNLRDIQAEVKEIRSMQKNQFDQFQHYIGRDFTTKPAVVESKNRLDFVTSPPPSTTSSSIAPQEPNDRVVLTRMATRGTEFYDDWRPVRFSFEPHQIKQIWAGFGSDRLDTQNCTIPNRRTIAVRVAPQGLGMNLIQLANYIMYAAYNSDFTLTWIATYEYDELHGSILAHPLQNWYEQHFTLKANDTTCDIFGTKCQMDKNRCYDGVWEMPSTNPKMNLWKIATYWASSFRTTFPELHDAYKTQLIREALRMTDDSRQELDKRVRSAIDLMDGLVDKFVIVMHVRRTDKITGEAKPVPASTFLAGLKHLISTLQPPSSQQYALVVISDDRQVEDEFSEAMSDFRETMNTYYRYAPARPDRVGSLVTLEESFWRLLVDLRLMIQADWFIGSQSSNLGVVACYLRVHEHCYNVEHPDLLWDAKQSKIA